MTDNFWWSLTDRVDWFLNAISTHYHLFNLLFWVLTSGIIISGFIQSPGWHIGYAAFAILGVTIRSGYIAFVYYLFKEY